MVFNIVPTVFELMLVSIILVSFCYWKSRNTCLKFEYLFFFQGLKCGHEFAFLSVGCVSIYTAYTLLVTQWRTKFRIYMNRAENEAGNKAMDSLINYETVKVYYIFIIIILILFSSALFLAMIFFLVYECNYYR